MERVTTEPINLRRKKLQDRLTTLLQDVRQAVEESTGPDIQWNQQSVQKLFRATTALHSFLLASASAIGECRKEKPYAPLKPVIDEQGQFKWCCDHNPEHCT